MSNNLPPVGFTYTIDSSTVNQSANVIASANARIANSQGQLVQRTQAVNTALDANSRSISRIATNLLSLSGVGGRASSVIGSLGAVSLPLAGTLVAVGAGAVAAKVGIEALQTSFERHQQTLAYTTRSYDELYNARIRALNTPVGAATGFQSGLESLRDATFDQTGRLIGETFGRAITEGMQGVLTPGRFAEIFSQLLISPADFFEKILSDARQKYIRAQNEIATAQYVNAAATRAAAASIQEEINRLLLAGATVDQLIPKYYELLKARSAFETPIRGPGAIGAGSTGVGAMAPPTGRDIEAEIARQSAYRQTTLAQNLYRDLLAAQSQFNSQYASAAADHQARLAQIESQGAEARARLQRNYERTLRDIQESLQESQAQAAADRAERIADAEQNAQERRTQLAQDYAERRIEIERTYQDRVKDVNEQYGVSVLDATIRRDATALLRAKDAKARGLRDAAEARQKDADKAKADYDKQKKQLDDALAKQRADIERDYRKRIDAAEAQARKAQAKAKENYNDALSDQQQAEAQARKSEKDSFTARQAQLATAFAARKAAIVAALAEEKNLTEAQAKAIITSLKGILNPAQITELLKALQQAIQAKIDITITPFAPKVGGGGGSIPPVGPVRAMGGYQSVTGGAYLHAGEWVLPNPVTAGMARFSDVLSSALRQYTAPVAQLAGRGGGDSRMTIEVLLNDGMLDARIVRGAINASVKVIKGSSPR